MKFIPIYIDAGITGFESPAAEYKDLGLSLDKLLIENPTATFIGIASGESMQQIGIFDKDLLIVDRAKSYKHNAVIVANYNGNFVCKILDKTNKRLLSASPLYQPVPITPEDDFQIEGVVVRSIRMFEPARELASCML